MKKISITVIGLIAMLMLLAAPVFAGNASAKELEGKKAKDSEWGGMTSADESTRQDAILASSLMDWDVQDAQGNTIGSVNDMVIGQDGNVEYIVLSQGTGFLGFGDTDLVPVPWSKVNTADIGEDQDAVTLSLSDQELENAPVFKEEEWQAFLKGERQQEVRGYYGTEDDPAEQMRYDKTGQEELGTTTDESYEMKKEETGGRGERQQEVRGYYGTEDEDARPSGQDQMMSERGAMTSADESARQDAILASSLMDWDVQDALGNKIGSVADMMIDQDGNVEYIVLSQGTGFLGFGDTDLVPVPWSKVNTGNISEDQDAVTLSMSDQELESAPVIKEEEWQAFLEGERQQEVRGYYGTEDAHPSEQMRYDKTGQEEPVESHEMETNETEGRSIDRRY